jgi:hypothetical protein
MKIFLENKNKYWSVFTHPTTYPVSPTVGELLGKQIGFIFVVNTTGLSNLTRAILLKPNLLLKNGC